MYGLCLIVTGFQSHVFCLYCLKCGVPFHSRLPREHAPGKMHSESLYIFTRFPSASSRAFVRAMKCAFRAELPGGRAFASSVFKCYDCIPSASPALVHRATCIGEQFQMQRSQGLVHQYGPLECTSLMTYRQSCCGDCAASVGSNVAGFRAEVS